jgi:hypothetical protein
MMASTFDAFLQQAWADHAEQAEAVARRLRTQTPAPETPDQLAALARLVVHLCGEHLGAFADGRWRLAALMNHPLADAAASSALRVGIASLTLAESGTADRAGFTLEEHIRCEAAAAAISLGRHQTERAMALLHAARGRLATLPDAGAAVHRPLGIACHNMAWVLHDRGGARSAEETTTMLELAASSKMHWAQAGTWLEVERGDYDLARCNLAAGLLDPALHFASLCLAGCTHNDAPPYEIFFAHEALALVQHTRGDLAACARSVAAAKTAFADLTASDQDACRSTLAVLQALAP